MDYIKGDKVKATHKETGEVHEFEVRANAYSPDYLVTTSGLTLHGRFWDFEKLIPPLPTKAGLYRPYEASGMLHLLLTTHGEWFWVDFEGNGKNWHVAEFAQMPAVQSNAATMTPVYLYDA